MVILVFGWWSVMILIRKVSGERMIMKILISDNMNLVVVNLFVGLIIGVGVIDVVGIFIVVGMVFGVLKIIGFLYVG